uniref:Ferric enterobactin uptake receptor n=1 Tax=uncultured Helicobacter sp. TaxID=175537 RepID=A0A650ELX8_9HELI|nr:ferric enterobactin uptake receptor [uncultured Helicobacter sp.]
MNKISLSVLTASLLTNVLLADEIVAGGGQSNNLEEDSSNVRKVNLGRSVVTASGYEQDIKDAPASISIIPQEEILTRPIRDLGDAVQDVPGVYVEQDKTGQNTISMRGLSSSYTLILIDGKRQNSTRGFIQNGLGNATSFMPPPEMIERIEVIRGPASVIYGSDAMGGVINIITKKHFSKVSAGVQLNTQLFEPHNEWGNNYGANAYVNTPLIKDKLSLNLRGSYRYNEPNAFLNPTGPSNGNPYAAHSSTGSQNWNAGFRLNYTPTKSDYLYLDSEVYNGTFGTLNTSQNNITSVQEMYKVNTILNHDGDYSWGKLSSYAQYTYNIIAPHASNSANGRLPIGATKGDYINWANKRTNQNVALQSVYNNDFDFGGAGSLIFNGGLYYLYEQLVGTISSRYRDMHQNQAAIFAEGEYLINRYVSATLGLRYTYADRYTTVPNPRFYVNYNPTDWLTFKAGVANGMLIPSLQQTFEGEWSSSTSGNTTTYTYGNPDLKPEQSWNYELSAIVDTEPAMFILTGYYTDFNNQIETLSSDSSLYIPSLGITCTGGCTTYRNIDKSLVTGAEASLKVKPFYGFALDASYGFTYTKNLSGSSKGEPINSIPKHTFTLKPSYTYQNFSAYIRWSGKFKTPTIAGSARTNVRKVVGPYYKDYQLVDIAATYKFNKSYMLTFAINNLFDVYFMDYAIYTNNNGNTSSQNRYQRILPSRNYWISFSANF